MPQVIILAGPNGAGKSTSSTRLVPRDTPFLNADSIARERAATPGRSADLAEGLILLRRLDEMEATRQSVAIETNLANRSLAARIPTWQANGSMLLLLSCGCQARTALLTARGGAFVAAATTFPRRQFAAGIAWD